MLDTIDWFGPLTRWQSWSIVAGNLLPLLGIVWLGWDASTLVILYWMETAVVGFWMILRMLFAAPSPEFTLAESRVASRPAGGIAVALFFLVHAGIFMAGHMFFLTSLAPGMWTRHLASPVEFWFGFVLPTGVWIPLAGLFVVRGILTVGDIRAGRAISHLVAGFYARIVLLQLVIIAGGGVALMLGSPVALLVLIVLLKSIFELYWDEVAGALAHAVSQTPQN